MQILLVCKQYNYNKKILKRNTNKQQIFSLVENGPARTLHSAPIYSGGGGDQ